MSEDTNGWDEWKNHVLAELERLNGHLEKSHESHAILLEKILEMDSRVKGLEIKAGVWGLLGGLIPALTAVILWKLQ